uniref:Mitochondrial import inner membrane translocase subunit Tim17 family protein n=1 Tax=Wuchereria bancrofti TaxID=6293 RepID=A0A1I8ENN5_WUCBA
MSGQFATKQFRNQFFSSRIDWMEKLIRTTKHEQEVEGSRSLLAEIQDLIAELRGGLHYPVGFGLRKSVARIRLHTDTSFASQSVKMVWPFNSTKPSLSASPNSSHSETQSTSLSDLAVMDSTASDLSDALGSNRDSTNMISLDRSPIFALDQLKQAGVPFEKQLSPYLQMDPTVFRESTPQLIFMYIVPGESKGELEFAMGRIGWAVLGGYALGSVRGILPELRNPNTRQLPFKPFMTRLMNSSVKHGSGFAHPAGSIVFIFSVADMIFGKLRAKDDLNAVAAGAVTGGLFRCARGLHASMAGAGIGAFAAFIWLLSDQDSRNRLWEVRKHLTDKQDYIFCCKVILNELV